VRKLSKAVDNVWFLGSRVCVTQYLRPGKQGRQLVENCERLWRRILRQKFQETKLWDGAQRRLRRFAYASADVIVADCVTGLFSVLDADLCSAWVRTGSVLTHLARRARQCLRSWPTGCRWATAASLAIPRVMPRSIHGRRDPVRRLHDGRARGEPRHIRENRRIWRSPGHAERDALVSAPGPAG
jgi:hypothetical protein